MQFKYSRGVLQEIHIRKPADMHHHFRSGDILETVAPLVAQRFAMTVAMPNLSPPLTNLTMVEHYYDALRGVGVPSPLMTLYLTDTLHPTDLTLDRDRVIVGVKYYPRGLTTNSENAVQDPASLWTQGSRPHEVLRTLAETNRVLLVHAADGVDSKGELLTPERQEPHFITETLPRIIDAHPNLKISVEHLSTAIGANFIRTNGGANLGCSLTAHHLLLHKGITYRGGFHPHEFWWPIIQDPEDREALRGLAMMGLPFVWLGSDSAPHPRNAKEAACCLGGVLMAHAGIELYVEAFEDMGGLVGKQLFENFASVNGPKFFGVEPSVEHIRLRKEPWTVRSWYYAGANAEPIRPFRLGEEVRWKLVV